MKIKYWIKALGLILFPTLSYAIFCPNNFNIIDLGQTVEQIAKQCGKPDKIVSKIVKVEGPQEWSYFVPQTVATQTMNATQGTLKTQIMFDANGKAINISVNGIGVGATNICGSNTVQLGDSRDRIKALCGDPVMVNRDTASQEQPKTTKVEEYTYNTNPPVTLVFENGILTQAD